MTWFAFHGYPTVDLAGVQEKDAVAFGFHGYGTEQEANANPNSVSFFQKPFVDLIEADYSTAQKEQAAPGEKNAGNPLGAATTYAGNVTGLSGVFGVLDAGFRQVTKASMWRSLGWLVLGGVFITGGVYWWAQTEGTQGMRSLAKGEKPRLTAPVLPLMLVMIGLYLDWFAVKYWEDTKTIWPSDPVKAILQGKGLPARAEDMPASSILTSSESSAASQSSGSGSGSGSGNATVPSSAANASNVGIAEKLFPAYGWDITQLVPLVSLWNEESGWSPTARNSGSGAFGIAQALGHGVPGGAAPDGTNEYGGYGLSVEQARAANSGVAYWQIVWGLNYIKDRYGSPSAAWAFETSHTPNWY